jgi:WD40 repeat protein
MPPADQISLPGFTRGATLTEGDDIDIKRFAWSSNRNRIAAPYQYMGPIIGIWDVNGGVAWNWQKAHRKLVTCVAWSRDDRLLASGSYDENIMIWDTARSTVPILKGHRDYVTNITWSPQDPGILASSSNDRSVRVWNTQTGAPLPVHGEHNGRVLDS